MAQIAVKERVLAGIGYSANPLAMREPPKTPRESSSAAQSNDGETGHFPVVPWDVVAESKGFEPLECLRIQRFSRRLYSPPLPPKTPRNRGALAILWGLIASLRLPIMANFMAKHHDDASLQTGVDFPRACRCRRPPESPWVVHANTDQMGGPSSTQG